MRRMLLDPHRDRDKMRGEIIERLRPTPAPQMRHQRHRHGQKPHAREGDRDHSRPHRNIARDLIDEDHLRGEREDEERRVNRHRQPDMGAVAEHAEAYEGAAKHDGRPDGRSAQRFDKPGFCSRHAVLARPRPFDRVWGARVHELDRRFMNGLSAQRYSGAPRSNGSRYHRKP